MTNGEGGQRLQAPLHSPAVPREPRTSASIKEHADYELRQAEYKRARELFEVLEPVATKAGELMSAVAGPDLRVTNAVVLVNEPVDPPVGAQCLHADLTPFETGFVGLLALSRYTLLWFSFGSRPSIFLALIVSPHVSSKNYHCSGTGTPLHS